MSQVSQYTIEEAIKICNLLMQNNSLADVCRMDGRPCRETVYKWLSENPEFADMYAKARVIRQDNRFDDIHKIADEEPDVSRAKLKIDTIKWQLAREAPRKYGDSTVIAGDKENPIHMVTEIVETVIHKNAPGTTDA